MHASIAEIIESHAKWTASAGQHGKRANFRGHDLSHQRFENINFAQASFRNAILQGTTFERCNLEEADFAESKGQNVTFTHCQMRQISFTRAQLDDAVFRHNAIEKSVFLQARGDKIQIEECNFLEANLREAIFTHITCTRVEMQKAILRNINFTYGTFHQVRFDGSDAKDALFGHANFTTVSWVGSSLRGANFEYVSLEDSDVTTAEDIDPAAIGAIEKTHAQQRTEELRQREEARAALNLKEADLLQRETALASERADIMRREAAMNELQTDLAWVTERVRSRATLLRICSAVWFIITAMLVMLVLHQLSRIGLSNMNLIEVAVVVLFTSLVLLLFIVSATATYRASRQLWQVVEEKERIEEM
jgi:fluoroquinolone resistance protein